MVGAAFTIGAMVKVEHVALWISDLEEMAAFYERFFGASRGEKYHNAAKGFSSYFLSFGTGARLELMQTTALDLPAQPRGSQRLGWTHLALSVGSESRVDELTQQLQNAGFERLDGPRWTGDGYYESVVLDPEGNRLELTV
ncbi:hypothetical protein Dxin01_02630 [Deinococcus xinjiangensis]|uniref:VOC domain-containing protein n=2 Tax=Deinococcus xinjiangensis TaxID=457454 RepID=A0ABP9VHQ4_9DEIO